MWVIRYEIARSGASQVADLNYLLRLQYPDILRSSSADDTGKMAGHTVHGFPVSLWPQGGVWAAA